MQSGPGPPTSYISDRICSYCSTEQNRTVQQYSTVQYMQWGEAPTLVIGSAAAALYTTAAALPSHPPMMILKSRVSWRITRPALRKHQRPCHFAIVVQEPNSSFHFCYFSFKLRKNWIFCTKILWKMQLFMLHFRGLHSMVTVVFTSESPVIISAHRSLQEHENISIAANPNQKTSQNI